jgi:drug/metabolite transporter (DMT)-like permease
MKKGRSSSIILIVAFATTLLTVVLLTPALWRRRTDLLDQLRRHRPLFGAAGLISGVAPLFGFSAIALGYVGYVTALFKLGAVFTVVWGALLLKELGLRERLPDTRSSTTNATLVLPR